MRKGLEIKEINARSILTKSRILDYCINPYGGCGIGCIYCYARFVGRVYGKGLLEWGRYVYPKVNSPRILRRECTRSRGGSIYMSSVTDPYQPLEAKYRLTRSLLGILLRYKHKFTVAIQTKSTLALRDLDLIRRFGDRVQVGYTITCDDEWARIFEPGASPTSARVEALKRFKEEGIRTYAFIGPILPYVSDPIRLAGTVRDYVDELYFDRLNLRPGVWASMKPVLARLGLAEKYRRILYGSAGFYDELRAKLGDYLRESGMACNILF